MKVRENRVGEKEDRAKEYFLSEEVFRWALRHRKEVQELAKFFRMEDEEGKVKETEKKEELGHLKILGFSIGILLGLPGCGFLWYATIISPSSFSSLSATPLALMSIFASVAIYKLLAWAVKS